MPIQRERKEKKLQTESRLGVLPLYDTYLEDVCPSEVIDQVEATKGIARKAQLERRNNLRAQCETGGGWAVQPSARMARGLWNWIYFGFLPNRHLAFEYQDNSISTPSAHGR